MLPGVKSQLRVLLFVLAILALVFLPALLTVAVAQTTGEQPHGFWLAYYLWLTRLLFG